jgi:hypothetical protein
MFKTCPRATWIDSWHQATLVTRADANWVRRPEARSLGRLLEIEVEATEARRLAACLRFARPDDAHRWAITLERVSVQRPVQPTWPCTTGADAVQPDE